MTDKMDDKNELSEQWCRETWYPEARKQTLETLPAFLLTVLDQPHNYGTICVAFAAGATAAAAAMDKDPKNGGITGFQASVIFWEIRKAFLQEEGPAQIWAFNNLLYPQYGSYFALTVPRSVADWVKTRAVELLAEKETNPMVPAHHEVVSHWRKLALGALPFGFTVEPESEATE